MDLMGILKIVILAYAGIHERSNYMDSGLRRSDENWIIRGALDRDFSKEWGRSAQQ